MARRRGKGTFGRDGIACPARGGRAAQRRIGALDLVRVRAKVIVQHGLKRTHVPGPLGPTISDHENAPYGHGIRCQGKE